MTDLNKLQKFLDDSYRASYLEGHVKGSIAYQIQALREQAGLNQVEFGELIGKTQSVVSRLEDTEYGGVNVNTLIEIACRLKIGLQVRFCDFETVLSANVSPDGLKVENIHQTVSRLQAPVTQTVNAASSVIVFPGTESSTTWQIVPNQRSAQVFPGSGTLSFERSMPMLAQPASHPLTLP